MIFAEFDEGQGFGIEAPDLPDQFASDGAAGAGDENALSLEARFDGRPVEVDLLPPEKIRQGNVPNGLTDTRPSMSSPSPGMVR